MLTTIANHTINITLMLFAPVPYNRDEQDLIYHSARKANRIWRNEKRKALELWEVDQAKFQDESYERYLEGRTKLLGHLTRK
jgi:hypothetical protein